MCKDGEGRHAIWEQKFDIKTKQETIIFECRDGSPLDSRIVAKSDPVKVEDGVQKITVTAVDDGIEGKKGEELGYLQFSIQKVGSASDEI